MDFFILLSLLFLHRRNFVLQRRFQPVYRLIEIVCCRNHERVVALGVMVVDDILDLPVLCSLGFDDQLCHNDTGIIFVLAPHVSFERAPISNNYMASAEK